MSGIKRYHWNGDEIRNGDLVKYADHAAEIARLRAEADALRAVASAAKEVAAWFTSGNSVPVDGVQVMRIGLKSVYADVHALNEALKRAAATGADA